MRRARGSQSLALMAILAVSLACASTPTTGPTAGPTPVPQQTIAPATTPATESPTAAAPADTAFEAVLAMIGPQGEVSAEMALQAFALAVAPLPGVTPPAGEPGRLDADLAVAWVDQVYNQLSPEHQAAIDAALAMMPDPYATASVAPAGGAGLRLATWPSAAVAVDPNCGEFLADPADVPSDIPPAVQSYVDMVKEAYDAIAGHLGRQSVSKLAVCLVPGEILSANGLARPFDAEHMQLGLPVSCAIYINADTIGAIGEAGQLGFLIAAETFACFQVTANPAETIASFGARVIAPWVRSGTSVWAAATIAAELFGGAGDVVSEPWSGYLTEPHLDLFARTNSAIGFFAQVDQDPAGPGAWNVLDEMLLSADAESAFYAATGRRQSFIDLWAAGYFRDASRGPDWDIIGPSIPDDTAEAGSIEVANGASEDMAAPVFAVAIADLSTSADITVLAGNHLRVHDGVQDFTDVRNQAYCTKDGGAEACACPADSPGAKLPPLPLLNTEAKLALTGMEFGGTATIQGLSLEDYCGAPPTPQVCSDSIPAGDYKGTLVYNTTTAYLVHDGDGEIRFTVDGAGAVTGTWDLAYGSTSSTGQMGTGAVDDGVVSGTDRELLLSGTNTVLTSHGTGASVPWPATPLTVQPVCDGQVVAEWKAEGQTVTVYASK